MMAAVPGSSPTAVALLWMLCYLTGVHVKALLLLAELKDFFFFFSSLLADCLHKKIVAIWLSLRPLSNSVEIRQ